MVNYGNRSDLGGLKPGWDCEHLDLPYECVNSTAATVVYTTPQIIAKAIAGANANGQFFQDGTAIDANTTITNIVVQALCDNEPILLDDGTEFTATNDQLAVKVRPNNGPNDIGLSCGQFISIGRGRENSLRPVSRLDTVSIESGAGINGFITVVNCVLKSKEECPVDFSSLTPAQTAALCTVVSQCSGWGGGGGAVDFAALTPQQTTDLCAVVNTCSGINPVINATPVAFVPTASGNATNRNSYVTDPAGDVWFIDKNGLAVKLYNVAAQPPVITPAPVAFVPTATGNATNRNSFVIDPAGDCWFIDTNGRGKKIELNVTQHALIAGVGTTVTGAGTLADPWVVNSVQHVFNGNGPPIGSCVESSLYTDNLTGIVYFCNGTVWQATSGGCSLAPITQAFAKFNIGDVGDANLTNPAIIYKTNICKIEVLPAQFTPAERNFRVFFNGTMPNLLYEVSSVQIGNGATATDNTTNPLVVYNKGLYSIDIVIAELNSSVQSQGLELLVTTPPANVAFAEFNWGDIGAGGVATLIRANNVTSVSNFGSGGLEFKRVNFTAAVALTNYVVDMQIFGGPLPSDLNILKPIVTNKTLLSFDVYTQGSIALDGVQNMRFETYVRTQAEVIANSTSFANLQIGDIGGAASPTIIVGSNVGSTPFVAGAPGGSTWFRVNFITPMANDFYMVHGTVYGTVASIANDNDLRDFIVFNKTASGYSIALVENASLLQNISMDLWTTPFIV